MSGQIQESFSAAFGPTTGATVFTGLPGGVANKLIVTTAIASGATLTLVGGGTVVVGNHSVGTHIPIKCTAISFGGAGAVVCLA